MDRLPAGADLVFRLGLDKDRYGSCKNKDREDQESCSAAAVVDGG